MERMAHRLGNTLSGDSQEAVSEYLRRWRRERRANAGVGQAVAAEISYSQGVGEVTFYHDDLGRDHLIIIPPPGDAGAKLIRSIRSLRRRATLGEYEKQLSDYEDVIEVILKYSPPNRDFVFEHLQSERLELMIKDIRRKQAPDLFLGSQIRKIEDFLDRGRQVKEA